MDVRDKQYTSPTFYALCLALPFPHLLISMKSFFNNNYWYSTLKQWCVPTANTTTALPVILLCTLNGPLLHLDCYHACSVMTCILKVTSLNNIIMMQKLPDYCVITVVFCVDGKCKTSCLVYTPDNNLLYTVTDYVWMHWHTSFFTNLQQISRNPKTMYKCEYLCYQYQIGTLITLVSHIMCIQNA